MRTLAPLNAPPTGAPEDDRQEQRHRRDGDEPHPLWTQGGQEREHGPEHSDVDVHPDLDRHGPERAVELALERQGVEHAGQRIPNAADQRCAFGEVGPGRLGRVIVGERQRRQRRREDEHRQHEHDPEPRIDPERPRPEEADEVAAVGEARRDQKAAGHEQGVEAHFAQRESDLPEDRLRVGRQPERADAVGEQHRHRRGQADEGEVVVPPDRVVGKPHRALLQAPERRGDMRKATVLAVIRPPAPAAPAGRGAAPSRVRRS